MLGHQYLGDHDPVAQIPNLADFGVGPHRVDQPEVAPEDCHAAVPVQAEQGITGELDLLKIRELSRPLATASRRPDEIAVGRELPNLVRATVRHDDAAIRQPPHLPHQIEVMRIARTRFRQVEQGFRTDPPARRVAPDGREGLDDRDPGAVALDRQWGQVAGGGARGEEHEQDREPD